MTVCGSPAALQISEVGWRFSKCCTLCTSENTSSSRPTFPQEEQKKDVEASYLRQGGINLMGSVVLWHCLGEILSHFEVIWHSKNILLQQVHVYHWVFRKYIQLLYTIKEEHENIIPAANPILVNFPHHAHPSKAKEFDFPPPPPYSGVLINLRVLSLSLIYIFMWVRSEARWYEWRLSRIWAFNLCSSYLRLSQLLKGFLYEVWATWRWNT